MVTQKNGDDDDDNDDDDDDDDNDDDDNDDDDYWWRSPLPLAGPEELLWFVPFVDQSLRWTSHVGLQS